MPDAQWQFLEDEFLMLSVTAAITRGKDNPTYITSATQESRAALGKCLRQELKRLQPTYERSVEEEIHIQNIAALATNVSAECTAFLNKGRLRFGRAQKVLNLYLKYLWCAGKAPMPPQCPFDSIVIGHLPSPYCAIAWTRLDDEAQYRQLVNAAKIVAGEQPLALWELTLFQRRRVLKT